MADQPVLADLISPRARAWTYALLAVVLPTLTLIALLVDDPTFTTVVLVVNAAAGFAGFQLARSNTPTSEHADQRSDRRFVSTRVHRSGARPPPA
jgi:hypothetical protein